LSIAKRKSRLPVLLFDYCSLLLQQLDIKIEEQLIYTLVDFADAFRDRDTEQDDDRHVLALRVSRHLAVPTPLAGDSLLWFNLLQIQPIALNLSFEAAPGMRARMSGSKWNPIDLLLSFAGTALASINAAPIRLNGLMFEQVRGSSDVILGSLVHHYRGEMIGEAYKVVGALEVLGNPVSASTETHMAWHTSTRKTAPFADYARFLPLCCSSLCGVCGVCRLAW
jgi:vacuolar protein sorting-associated protein 13A/C